MSGLCGICGPPEAWDERQGEGGTKDRRASKRLARDILMLGSFGKGSKPNSQSA